jgi:transcriptional regulator with XRE-family HTH domain
MHFRTGQCVGQTDIAKAADRTQPWVAKWEKSPSAPKDYTTHRPLAAYLGVDEDWLIRGEGEPPEPDLWDRWSASRAPRVAPVPTAAVRAAPSSKDHGKDAKRRRAR